MAEFVRTDTADGVARITLDSPHNRNALSARVRAELSAALGMAMRNRSSGLFETFERSIDAMVEHRDARARD